MVENQHDTKSYFAKIALEFRENQMNQLIQENETIEQKAKNKQIL